MVRCRVSPGATRFVVHGATCFSVRRHSVAARVATYFKRKAASALAPGEGEPPRDWPRLQQLRIDLAEARSTAEPFLAAVRHREGQIAALRACPRPDRAVMEALGLGYNTVPASRRRGAA